MDVKSDWKSQAVKLDSVGIMSWRQISKVLGVPKSSLSDYLRGCVKSDTGVSVVKSEKPANEGRTHLYIPDSQVREGVPLEFLTHIGKYIVKKQPSVIVHAGDFADMESCSTYDKGKRSAEGKRIQADINVSIKAMGMLLAPLREYQALQRSLGEKVYEPRMVMTLGNHEARLTRHVNAHPELHGFLGIKDLRYEEFGWEVIPFLTPVVIDDISYCHYFPNVMTGKPLSGSVANMLKTIGTSFTQGHRQTLDVATRFLPTTGQQQWGIVAGACLDQKHKVLKADLTYVTLGDIVVGDTLLSFEEEVTDKRSRRYKTGTVEKVRKVVKETFNVTLASGKVFTVTEDHKWFVKTGSVYRWARTDELRKGTCIPKLVDEWKNDDTFLGGWLAGMYDGEGHLSQRVGTDGRNSFQLGISQNKGKTCDKFIAAIKEKFGMDILSSTMRVNETTGKECMGMKIAGGVPKCIKVLGSLRPNRLLEKFTPDSMGRICCEDSRNDKVVSIIAAGQNTVVEIQVDCGTMVVEGYGHHNCYEHDEEYKGVQGNHHWRGIILKHNVKQGSYDPLFISLDWLKNEYADPM